MLARSAFNASFTSFCWLCWKCLDLCSTVREADTRGFPRSGSDYGAKPFRGGQGRPAPERPARAVQQITSTPFGKVEAFSSSKSCPNAFMCLQYAFHLPPRDLCDLGDRELALRSEPF